MSKNKSEKKEGKKRRKFTKAQLAAIFIILIMVFNAVGDGLRDALDPKLRK